MATAKPDDTAPRSIDEDLTALNQRIADEAAAATTADKLNPAEQPTDKS